MVFEYVGKDSLFHLFGLFSVELVQKENAIYHVIEVRELQQQSMSFLSDDSEGLPKNGGLQENGSDSVFLLASKIIKTEVN